MDDIKVYTPTVVQDTAFPQDEVINTTSSQKTSNNTYSAEKTQDQEFPVKRVAVELLSSALNTKSRKILTSFEFTPSGALQIGKYENGVSGDIKISPNGIVARNLAGDTTFTLDGDTGNAVFAGTLQAGTLIGGAVAVGDGSILIDGETRRMIFFDENGVPVILIGNS